MIIAIGGVVICVVAGGIFWLWLQATHGEVGPALVATAISLAVIIGAMMVALKVQDRTNDDSWLNDGRPGYAVAQAELTGDH